MVKNLSAMQETWVGKIPWKGNGYQLQNSCLENSMDRRAWQAIVYEVAKNQTPLSNFHKQEERPQVCLSII